MLPRLRAERKSIAPGQGGRARWERGRVAWIEDLIQTWDSKVLSICRNWLA